MDDVDVVPVVVAGHASDLQDLERIEAPGRGGHHAYERHVLVRVGDGSQALLEVADLRRLEEREAADHGVGDALVAQAGDDGLAVAVLAIEDREAGPVGRLGIGGDGVPATLGLDAVHDLACLVLDVGRDHELDRLARPARGAQDLVWRVAQLVALDEPVGDREHGLHRAEVLLEPQPRGRARGPARWGRARAGR